MKRIVICATGILIIIIIGIMVINVKEIETEVTKNQTKVGFVMNGSITDHSWGQSHYEGMEKSSKELNLEVLYRENVLPVEDSEAVMEELIEQGCKIIICNSFEYGEVELEMARKYPDIYFFHATGVEEKRNLSTYFGRIYQMRYLSGIVAGLQTETNEIGYVAAMPISEVNRGINAFTLGVRMVNPEAEVYVEWCESWTEDEQAAKATEKLLSKHKIDVLAIHTNSLKPLEIAEERGIWSIGYNLDNRELYPNSFLTAPIWKWENFYTPRILECLQGKFRGIHYWEGADSKVIALSPMAECVSDETQRIVAENQSRLMSGSFDVFYGPIKDSDGRIRIKEGESMTDEAMLNEFDWYVEGVVLDEE